MSTATITCPKCHKEVAKGEVQERRSFGVYAGKFCESCCSGYRDNCGLDQAQGSQADLDEPIEPEEYYGSEYEDIEYDDLC